ncbi:MAG: hypothetical protein MJK15_08180 [Colwellia sp.]|nr:hypothetical protein [Colwellia sp.]
MNKANGIFINKKYLGIIALVSLISSGCGVMKFNETHYYAVKSDDNVNVYRLIVKGNTVLSDAKYQSGWYPKNAVDSLYGNVRNSGGSSALQAKQDIEKLSRESTVRAISAYYKVAENPNSSEDDIQKAMQVRRRVLAYPTLNENIPKNSQIIDYNPSLGLAISHIDEKMVFILSANPDIVVGNIKNFAESDKTALTISQLAKVSVQRARNEIVAAEAKEIVYSEIVHFQLEESISLLEKMDGADKDEIAAQIDILLEFIEGMK